MGTDRVAYLDLPPDNILAQVHIRQRRGANEMQMGIELCDRGSQRLVRDVLEDGGAEFLVGCGESGGAFDFARRRLAFDRARYPIDFLRPEFLCRDAHGCRFEELAHLYDVAKFRGRGEGDRSEEHTSELQSLMHNSYAVF